MLLLRAEVHVLGSLGLQDMTQEEKAQHTRRLTDAVEKLKKNSRKSVRCGASQDQAQAAASQRSKRKMMDTSGDSRNQRAELPLHWLWSRKYQPLNMSEVISEHS